MFASKWINLALNEAKKAYKKNNVPIGCVIIKDNKLIAKAHNQEFWHAEIIAIQKAQKKTKDKFLNNCQIFCTLEPCPMCLHAIKLARIKTLVYFENNNNEPLPKLEKIKIHSEKSKKFLIDFFKNKRKL